MGFYFHHVCDLLQHLEDNQTARSDVRSSAEILREWFAQHRAHFLREDHDIAALLSTLLPEKRSDRVYNIREKKLQTIVGRALILGRSRILQLGRWNTPGSGVTLAECVEGILKQTPNPKSPAEREVTVEEIDGLLHNIASMCQFSSPVVRKSAKDRRLTDRELGLGNLYQRVTARDAKWLTRLILKNFDPIVLDPLVVYRSYNPFLSSILKVQDDFTVAARILATQKRERTVTGRAALAEYLKPALGVKVGRQPWFKGRSIKHCLDMNHGRMSCETKMDGEYCQIHIDLSRGYDCIQIFSKSGKDSTKDRAALHDSIRKSLQLGQPFCPLKKGCILEGELVVYSDKDGKILDFHKIRKHVSRSGSFLGTGQDSQPQPWEHLMIVYYDLLMVDDESLLAVRQSERFGRLKHLVAEVPGRSALVKRQIIDGSRPSATSDLRRAFAECITARHEGLVLKPDDPYFDFDTSRRPYSCCAIKLKKEYVGNFGDIGDFAVVGARFDAAKAKTYGTPRLKWTQFYVGCLDNKDEVLRFHRRPRFVVTNVVELNATQLNTFLTFVNPVSVPEAENDSISLRIEPGIDDGKRPSTIFTDPPVFDLRCFSFDKVGNTGFWSPRFPVVNKIHCDRTYRDTLSFSELQDMAIKEKELPPPDDSQELLGWIAALENADPQSSLIVDASSQATTATTESTIQTLTSPSIASASQNPLAVSSPLPMEQTRTLPEPYIRPQAEVRAAVPGAPPTPPRSSAIQASETITPTRTADKTGSALVRQKKRSYESLDVTEKNNTSPGRTKVRRCSGDQTAATGTTGVSQVSVSTVSSSSNSQREPISDIRASSLRRNSVIRRSCTGTATGVPPRLGGVDSMYQPNLEKFPAAAASTSGQPGSLALPTSTSSHVNSVPAATKIATPPTSSDLSRAAAPPRAAPPPTTATTTTHSEVPDNKATAVVDEQTAPAAVAAGRCCKYLRNLCSLAGCSLLLSPCIADYPWVTEDLLSCHGVREYIRDPRGWLVRDSDGRVKTTTERRLVILVDARRKEPTKTFLNLVGDTGLTYRTGERRWIEVYDWRVLEGLRTDEERLGRDGIASRDTSSGGGHVSSAIRATWRKDWVGLA
ncbi:hypothetical protein B0H66DRAFT_588289 [Apodospora peruviana]|uniref:ATP-dependent DNA ligase family profile domain-containing protein n=1 Tax=Apodospora peruviana TaxID=516989 RepID=A0AAE0MB10_9PEZI|nr:hypothetical protein B0H66DRAFT_588289 [Apodospora peruviana]